MSTALGRRFAPLLALALVACSTTPPPRPPPPPPPGHWTRVLPEDMVNVQIEAREDCVFLLGKRLGVANSRGTVCLDAESGERVWSRTDPGAPESLLVGPGRLVHVGRGGLVAHDRATGEVAWRHEAPRTIYAAEVVAGHVVMSVGNDALVALDLESGAWRGGWRMENESLKAVLLDEEGGGEVPVVAVLVRARDDAQPSLVAVSLGEVAGGGPRSPELPRPAERWATEITPWSFKVDRVGEALIGDFQENQLWGVAVKDGAVLWRQGLDRFEGERIEAPTRVLTHRLVKATDNPGDPSQVVETRGWTPAALGQGEPSWSLRVPSPWALLGLDPIPSAPGRAFSATNDQLLLIDVEQGAIVWSYVLGADAGRWTSATSNGAAAYVLYRSPQSRAGALGRIPILVE